MMVIAKFTAFKVCKRLVTARCFGDCKTFDKLVIAKCVTYW